VGTAESVLVLSGLLDDTQLSDAARQTLEAIPGGASEGALRRVLRTVKGPLLVDGVKLPPTSDRVAPRYEIHLADPQHPITRGLQDVVIDKNETYKNYVVNAGAAPLLTTDFARSDKVLAWTDRCRKSRTACFQPGHARSTFQPQHTMAFPSTTTSRAL
jgi:hypothetical protein